MGDFPQQQSNKIAFTWLLNEIWDMFALLLEDDDNDQAEDVAELIVQNNATSWDIVSRVLLSLRSGQIGTRNLNEPNGHVIDRATYGVVDGATEPSGGEEASETLSRATSETVTASLIMILLMVLSLANLLPTMSVKVKFLTLSLLLVPQVHLSSKLHAVIESTPRTPIERAATLPRTNKASTSTTPEASDGGQIRSLKQANHSEDDGQMQKQTQTESTSTYYSFGPSESDDSVYWFSCRSSSSASSP